MTLVEIAKPDLEVLLEQFRDLCCDIFGLAILQKTGVLGRDLEVMWRGHGGETLERMEPPRDSSGGCT